MEGSKTNLGLALASRQPGEENGSLNIMFATKEDEENIMEVQFEQVKKGKELWIRKNR